MKCSKCGTEIHSGDRVCSQCGAVVSMARRRGSSASKAEGVNHEIAGEGISSIKEVPVNQEVPSLKELSVDQEIPPAKKVTVNKEKSLMQEAILTPAEEPMVQSQQICRFCGSPVESDASFCGHCGKPQIEDHVSRRIDQPAQNYRNFCPHCGKELEPDAVDCRYCGSPVYDDSRVYRKKAGLSKEAFINLEEMEPLVRNTKHSAMICYIAAGITAAVILLTRLSDDTMIRNIIGIEALIDVASLIVLGLIIHLRKSFVASVVLFSFSIINSIYSIYLNGRMGGWLLLIAGFYAVINTHKLNKAWKEYQKTGLIPVIQSKKK